MPYRLATPQSIQDNKARKGFLCVPVSKMGWIVGFEPTVSSATNWRFNQLSYTHHMARLKGLEPLTHCLEGSCSIHLSYRRTCQGNGNAGASLPIQAGNDGRDDRTQPAVERVMGIEPT